MVSLRLITTTAMCISITQIPALNPELAHELRQLPTADLCLYVSQEVDATFISPFKLSNISPQSDPPPFIFCALVKGITIYPVNPKTRYSFFSLLHSRGCLSRIKSYWFCTLKSLLQCPLPMWWFCLSWVPLLPPLLPFSGSSPPARLMVSPPSAVQLTLLQNQVWSHWFLDVRLWLTSPIWYLIILLIRETQN